MPATPLNASTNFPTQIATEMFSKVRGYSSLAKLSAQSPIPFNGITEFVFNLDSEASIVGEGGAKPAATASATPVVIRPIKFVYQARVSDEFLRASDEARIGTLQAFADGFAKKIARGLDIAALHGLNPADLTAASFQSTNSFDGLCTGNDVNYVAASVDDNISAAISAVQADGGDVQLVDVAEDGTVTVELVGACKGCPLSEMTLANGIERILKERVPGVMRVVPAEEAY